MRRPLCLLGLAFVMVLLLGINLIPHEVDRKSTRLNSSHP